MTPSFDDFIDSLRSKYKVLRKSNSVYEILKEGKSVQITDKEYLENKLTLESLEERFDDLQRRFKGGQSDLNPLPTNGDPLRPEGMFIGEDSKIFKPGRQSGGDLSDSSDDGLKRPPMANYDPLYPKMKGDKRGSKKKYDPDPDFLPDGFE